MRLANTCLREVGRIPLCNALFGSAVSSSSPDSSASSAQFSGASPRTTSYALRSPAATAALAFRVAMPHPGQSHRATPIPARRCTSAPVECECDVRAAAASSSASTSFSP